MIEDNYFHYMNYFNNVKLNKIRIFFFVLTAWLVHTTSPKKRNLRDHSTLYKKDMTYIFFII